METIKRMKKLELRLPPPLVAIFVFGLEFLVSKIIKITEYQLFALKIIAVLLILGGFVLGIIGIQAFRKKSTTILPNHPEQSSVLVQDGIYAYTRNPMYLGIFVGLVGIAFYYCNFASLLISFLFPLYITRFQILPEERALREKFGDVYQNYMQKVRRWL